MKTILLIGALIAIGWLVYNRRRVVASVPVLRALSTLPFASGRPGDLAPLIAALYGSIIDKSHMTWWTRTHHIDGGQWTIVAAPHDAAVLARSISAVETDLNAALIDNADRHRIVIGAPLRIVGVVSDSGVPPGRPRMRSDNAIAPRPPVVARAATDHNVARAPRRTPAIDGEAPTKVVATIGETLVDSRSIVRLWPVGSEASDDPIIVPTAGIVLGRSPDLGAGRITERTVSKRHAEVCWEGDAWILKDLNSRNGTFLGARRVGQAKLQSGDTIGLGRHVRLRMIVGEQPLEATANQRG